MVKDAKSINLYSFYLYFFSALPLSGWNVTVLMSSYFGFSIQWSSLRTNVGQTARFYLILINSPAGNLLAVETVPGSATTKDITGLRPSTRYRIGVYGIDETGQAYKSSENLVSTPHGKLHSLHCNLFLATCNRDEGILTKGQALVL